MATARHSLTNKNLEALTATCAVCGDGVRVRVSRGKWICVAGNRQARARYRKAHPDRAAADRKFRPSKHRLQNRKGGEDICSICGPVVSVPQGWGYMCPTRAVELGWKPTQSDPQPLCPSCKKRHLDNMGACPLCDEPLPRYDQRPGQEWDPYDEFDAAGLSVRDGFADLSDANESAVAGWKTLGYDDSGVRPEYAALYGGK